jgi:hypothetical protein
VQLGIAARTGGANENHWIDDLLITGQTYDIAGPERGQTVTFQVSNNNPALFAVQPAISTDGTLTYTPAPNACGSAVVTVVLKDNGGTANGGTDTSVPVQFTIAVNPLNDSCPVAEGATVQTLAGTPVAIHLVATDNDNETGCGTAVLGYGVMLPQHGVLQGILPDVVYTPDPGYCGADSFQFLVEDGVCFDTAVVNIEVMPFNTCPTATPQSVTACGGTPVAITLAGVDPDTGGCGPTIQGFTVVTEPMHGVLSGTAPALTYTAAAGYIGLDSFTFTVTDGQCVSAPARVSIVVLSSGAPHCQIVVGPRLVLTPDVTENIVCRVTT